MMVVVIGSGLGGGHWQTFLIKHTPMPIQQHLSKDYFIFNLLIYYYFLGFLLYI
jgi:hypothetical protein